MFRQKCYIVYSMAIYKPFSAVLKVITGLIYERSI